MFSVRSEYVTGMKGCDTFGVLLKGRSLELLPKYHLNFDKCFIVSDFDDELRTMRDYVKGKQIIHFTNRSRQAQLNAANYRDLNITHIQTGQVFRFNHFRLIYARMYRLFQNPFVRFCFLPEHLLDLNKDFPPEYALKYPNTGILAAIFAILEIRPKNLWVFGLDFYESDYMESQTQDPGLPRTAQNDKIVRLGLKDHFMSIVERNQDTNVFMGTDCSDIPDLPNLTRV